MSTPNYLIIIFTYIAENRRAKPKGSNCLPFKQAATAFWLCKTQHHVADRSFTTVFTHWRSAKANNSNCCLPLHPDSVLWIFTGTRHHLPVLLPVLIAEFDFFSAAVTAGDFGGIRCILDFTCYVCIYYTSHSTHYVFHSCVLIYACYICCALYLNSSLLSIVRIQYALLKRDCLLLLCV